MTDPIAQVHTQADRWVYLRDQIFGADEIDAQAVMDTLEGETNLLECLADLGQRVVEIENETLPGIDAYVAKLTTRRRRAAKSAETLRTIILTVMERAGITEPIKSPLFTLTACLRAPGLLITNEAEIPSEYFKDVDPKLDRKALKAALTSAEPITIPGAGLDNGSKSLTIRIA